VRALSLLVFLALAGSATAAVLGSGKEPSAQASAVGAEGSFSFANSRDGMPIFSATGIGPGNSASGTVEIANTGTLPGELVLAQHDVADVPGAGGGELSEQLSLRITDVTAPASPTTVYAGPLAPMPAQPVGQLEPGESRTYEFVATLPEAGSASAQNDVQGASASVAFAWTAGEVVPGSSPGPTPAPSPSPARPASSPAPEPPGSSPAPPQLRLTIARVRRTIRHGRLLVLARCSAPCRITAGGRLRARNANGRRSAELHLPRPHGYTAGRQRLSIRVPPKFRRWLGANPDRLHLTARVALRARGLADDQAAARRVLRVRSVTRSSFARNSDFGR
jgi:hypothetical protein